MGLPRYLVENFFDVETFPSHTITAEEAATGYEAWRVGGARRSALNYWTSTTANSATWIQSANDRVRAADMIVVDRINNLAGATINLQVSSDAFTTYTQIFSLTFPTYVFPGSRLDDEPGVLNEEGAWLYKFNLHVGKEWRLNIAAMGAGIKPEIGGLYLGQSWQPTNMPLLPWNDETRQLQYSEIVSDTLWAGQGRKASRRKTSTTIRMATEKEYDKVRYHFHSLYWRGRVMWAVHEDQQAERSWLAYAPRGEHGAPYPGDWPQRVLTIQMLEHEPRPI